VYWPIPRNALIEQKAAFYKIQEHFSNIKFIEVDMYDSQGKELNNLPPELVDKFDTIFGRMSFDILICEKPNVLTPFLSGIQMYQRSRETKVIVGNIHYLVNCARDTHFLESVEREQTLSCSDCDFLQFASASPCTDSRKTWLSNMRKYTSSAKVAEAMNIPSRIKPCFDPEEVLAVAKKYHEDGGKKSKTFQIHYGCSLTSMFGYEKIFTAMGKLALTDKDFHFKVTTPSNSMGRKKTSGDWFSFNTSCARQNFYKYALKSHVCVMWGQVPDGINHGGILEMCCLGVLPIFKKNSLPFPWNINCPEYPFVFSNEEELLAQIKNCKENYDGDHIQGWLNHNVKLITEQYKQGGLCCYEDFICDLEEESRERLNKSPWVHKKLLSSLPTSNSYNLEEVIDFVKNNVAVTGFGGRVRSIASFQIGTIDELRTGMLELGWSDTGTLDEIRFERVGTIDE
jgi:hypothetical protein